MTTESVALAGSARPALFNKWAVCNRPGWHLRSFAPVCGSILAVLGVLGALGGSSVLFPCVSVCFRGSSFLAHLAVHTVAVSLAPLVPLCGAILPWLRLRRLAALLRREV